MRTGRKYYRRKKRVRRAVTVVVLALFLGAAGFAWRALALPHGDVSEDLFPPAPSAAPVEEAEAGLVLPSSFDLRETTVISQVPDQGNLGTCWAFASLMAVEMAMSPETRQTLSADHMSLKNSFQTGQNEGGEYSMAMAYLLAWQGPVAEADDPYGDGVSPDGLDPLCHVQEVRILPERDLLRIKEEIFTVGGVQSSLYMPVEGGEKRLEFYREDTFAYFYDGTKKVNHDVVIIGWDDAFSRENFRKKPEKDGAFLCMNSWGNSFGDEGCFYVSYEDSRLGLSSVVYSGVEAPDNYDRIYQTDLKGWTGQMGYGGPTAWFANVYEAKGEEQVEAAGFYATMKDTSYRIWVAENIPPASEKTGVSASLLNRKPVAEGAFTDAGFYTVKFERPLLVTAGERFAVIVEITTPDAVQPVAIEYLNRSNSADVDIEDGEGYISPNGSLWNPAGEQEPCRLCLKSYSRITK